MKSLVSIGLFVVVCVVGWPAGAAESWVYGVGTDKVAAKEAALEVASANLPAGVAFHVADENFVANKREVTSSGSSTSGSSVPGGWTCNILVRYGTGVRAVEGVAVYHAYTHVKSTGKPSTKVTKTTKTIKTPTPTRPARATSVPRVNSHPTMHGIPTR